MALPERDSKGRFLPKRQQDEIPADVKAPVVLTHEWYQAPDGQMYLVRKTKAAPPNLWMKFARWLRFARRG